LHSCDMLALNGFQVGLRLLLTTCGHPKEKTRRQVTTGSCLKLFASCQAATPSVITCNTQMVYKRTPYPQSDPPRFLARASTPHSPWPWRCARMGRSCPKCPCSPAWRRPGTAGPGAEKEGGQHSVALLPSLTLDLSKTSHMWTLQLNSISQLTTAFVLGISSASSTAAQRGSVRPLLSARGMVSCWPCAVNRSDSRNGPWAAQAMEEQTAGGRIS
jgi:hypothetical protein